MAKKKKGGATRLGYTPDHAASGLTHPLPAIECWPNQFPGYEIEIETSCYNPVYGANGEPRVFINLARWVRGANSVPNVLRS